MTGFIEKILGIPCRTDRDCNGARCNMNTFSCSIDRDTLAMSFIACFANLSRSYILEFVVANLPNISVIQGGNVLEEEIFWKLQLMDCVSNVSIDPIRQSHYVRQSFLTGKFLSGNFFHFQRLKNFGCDYLCKEDPICL